jgi:hypothetical protein
MTRRTKEYREGWKACESGLNRGDCPYWKTAPFGTPALETAARAMQWGDGFEARANRGFDVSHLPRKPFSDAFA